MAPQEARVTTPEALVRLHGLLGDVLVQGRGAPVVFPGKFQVAVQQWLVTSKEMVHGCPAAVI